MIDVIIGIISVSFLFFMVRIFMKFNSATYKMCIRDRYRTEAENVQNVIDKMDRLLDTLLTEWEEMCIRDRSCSRNHGKYFGK